VQGTMPSLNAKGCQILLYWDLQGMPGGLELSGKLICKGIGMVNRLSVDIKAVVIVGKIKNKTFEFSG